MQEKLNLISLEFLGDLAHDLSEPCRRIVALKNIWPSDPGT